MPGEYRQKKHFISPLVSQENMDGYISAPTEQAATSLLITFSIHPDLEIWRTHRLIGHRSRRERLGPATSGRIYVFNILPEDG